MWTGRSIVDTSKAQCPVEEFSVADQAVGTMGEAFGAGIAERGGDLRSKQNLLVVVVDAVTHLLDEAFAEVLRGETERRVHEAEAGCEAQCESSAQRVDLGQVFRCGVVAECSVASRRDAADVAQSTRVDVGGRGECPWATLRPAGHSEFVDIPTRRRSRPGRRPSRSTCAPSADWTDPCPAGRRRPAGSGSSTAECCEEPGLEPAARAAVVVDDQRPVRISDFEIRETTAVSGLYRLRWVVRRHHPEFSWPGLVSQCRPHVRHVAVFLIRSTVRRLVVSIWCPRTRHHHGPSTALPRHPRPAHSAV